MALSSKSLPALFMRVPQAGHPLFFLNPGESPTCNPLIARALRSADAPVSDDYL